MARTTRKKETAKETAPAVTTRAEKKDATKQLVKELLAQKPLKHSELIDGVANLYAERFGSEETENINDVKGRVGSVLDIMKKESDVAYEGGMYALKARVIQETPIQETEKTPAKKTRKKAVKEEVSEEKPVKKTAKKAEKSKTGEEVAEVKTEEDPTPKKRGRKPKAKTEETIAEAVKEETPKTETAVEEPKTEVVAEEPKQLVVKEKAEIAKKNVVMDMSFLFGGTKPQKPVPEKTEEPVKIEEKPVKQEEKAVKEVKEVKTNVRRVKGSLQSLHVEKKKTPVTAEERLKEAYLKRIRSLGGDYFEYYSVYLLERYSMKNGRRLEGMKISGGDHDGGIDGEIELTDKFGFRETIYIQSKNWNPEKGNEKLWVVGETLLQQFIGACACRQAKDGKQHCRGIFITTSRFTPEAKRILDSMSDKIVGYDGDDLFEAAKECSFGLIEKNGNWILDEKLLSGTKAFFNLY